MINKRARCIILEIIKQGAVKTSKLAETFKVSKRTVRFDIDDINYFLKENNFEPLVRNENKEITFVNKENITQLIYKLINQKDIVTASYTKDERILEILYQLCMNKNAIKIDDFAELLFVSKSTIVKDLDRLRHLVSIKDEEIKVVGNSNGVTIQGNEVSIRILLANMYITLMDKRTVLELLNLISNENVKITYKVYWRLFENVDLKFIIHCVEIMKSMLSIHLVDRNYLYSLALCSISFKRIESCEDNYNLNFDYKSKISENVIGKIYDMLEKKYYIKNIKTEIATLQYILYSISSQLYAMEHEMELKYLEKDALKLVDGINKKMCLESNDLLMNISDELKKIYIEKKLNLISFENVIELKEDEYLKVYKDVIYEWKKIGENRIELCEDDYWRLSWHFIDSIQKQFIRKKVLIVSDKPKSLIYILINNLKKNFDIEILGITGYAQLDKYLRSYDVDYIISTMKIEASREVIKVHPLLSAKEVMLLKQYLDTYKLNKVNKASSQNDIFKEYFLSGTYESLSEVFEDMAQVLLKKEIVKISILKILENNTKNLKKDYFIKEGVLIINVRNHEIIKENCVINLSLNKRIRIDGNVEIKKIKLISSNRITNYLKYLEGSL